MCVCVHICNTDHPQMTSPPSPFPPPLKMLESMMPMQHGVPGVTLVFRLNSDNDNNNSNNNDDDIFSSIALFHVRHAQLR